MGGAVECRISKNFQNKGVPRNSLKTSVLSSVKYNVKMITLYVETDSNCTGLEIHIFGNFLQTVRRLLLQTCSQSRLRR